MIPLDAASAGRVRTGLHLSPSLAAALMPDGATVARRAALELPVRRSGLRRDRPARQRQSRRRLWQAVGPGGFINISQKARTIVFCGTLRGAGLEVRLVPGKPAITREGRCPKFVPEVSHMSFNAARAVRCGQRVLYVTERAVFQLTGNGVELIELALGADLRGDRLDQMGFVSLMRFEPRTMDPRLFRPEFAGLKHRPCRETTTERPQYV